LEYSSQEEAIAPSCLRALAFVSPERTPGSPPKLKHFPREHEHELDVGVDELV
jgi:hypothetical protein